MAKDYQFRLTNADRERFFNMSKIENELYQAGHRLIAGVDEAGRGPLAGPVTVAACVLDPEQPIFGLNDSKKLTEKRRNYLFDQIKEKAIDYKIVFVPVDVIETKNILEATKQGMTEAILGLSRKPDLVLIDAVRLGDERLPAQRSLVHGDAVSNSIAAASILAKVSRDQFMIDLAKKFPEYGFERHKGYATASHYQAIREHGVMAEHRLSFLHKLKLGEADPNTTSAKGNSSEMQVAQCLMERGYELLASNFWIRNFGEIDLIMHRGRRILFVEVKARQDQNFENRAIDALDSKKQWRIKTLADYYLQSRKTDAEEVVFLLAAAKLNANAEVETIKFFDF